MKNEVNRLSVVMRPEYERAVYIKRTETLTDRELNSMNEIETAWLTNGYCKYRDKMILQELINKYQL